jgi:hypothetical protein
MGQTSEFAASSLTVREAARYLQNGEHHVTLTRLWQGLQLSNKASALHSSTC